MRRPASLVLVCAFLAAIPAMAAIPTATVWEMWPTSGSDTNGGAFVPMSHGGSAQLADLAIDAATSTKITSASHSFVAGDVKKYLKVTSGAGFNLGGFQILSVAAGAATVDHSAGVLASTAGGWTLYASVDHSQQAAAQVTIDNSVITATCNGNVITFVGGSGPYTPTTADLDNFVQFPPGIVNITAGFYQLTATNSTTTWTISGIAANACTAAANPITLGTSSVATKMGGALASIAAMTSSNYNAAWVKATGILTVAATTTLSTPNSTVNNANPPFRISGYTSTRGDGGRVTIRPSAPGLTIFTVSGQGYELYNFFIDGSNGANTVGTCISNTGANNSFSNIKCGNWTSTGFSATAGNFAVADSEFLAGQGGCTAGLSWTSTGVGTVVRNTIHGNNCTGISSAASGVFIGWNLLYGTSAVCISAMGSKNPIFNNTLDGCTIGLTGTSGLGEQVRNNLITNSTTGMEIFTSAGWQAKPGYDGNCYWNNTTNRLNSDDQGTVAAENVYPYINTLDQILGASPYVDDTHASGNYAIKSSGGAYQVGTPGALPGVSQLGFPSCGALTPQVAGPGSVSTSVQ